MNGNIGPLGRNTSQYVRRKQLLLFRNVRIAEQLNKSSGRLRDVSACCDCLYISLQFYDCKALGMCPSIAS